MAITNIDLTTDSELNITCTAGDTFDLTIEFYEDEAQTIESDITGSIYKSTVSGGLVPTGILFFTMDDGITIIPPNKLRLLKSSEEMEVPADVYRYSIKQITGGIVNTEIIGRLNIEKDETP